MTLKNNRASFLYHVKLCASFQNYGWIRTGVIVRKRPLWVKIGNFCPLWPLEFDRWPRKTIEHLFYATSSCAHHFIAITEFILELQSVNAQFGSKSTILLAMWHWNLTDYLENNRASLLSNIKLHASFHNHMWIQIWVRVQKWLSWVLTSVTVTFQIWPWTFAWTLRLPMVILSKGVTDDGRKDGRTVRRTDIQTDGKNWSESC